MEGGREEINTVADSFVTVVLDYCTTAYVHNYTVHVCC